MSRLRNWVFTKFVEEEKDYDNIFSGEDRVRCAIWQLERSPSTGRLHLQGYAEFTCALRMAQVKHILHDDTVHLEARQGSREQAIAYCRKDETRVRGPWEFGNLGDVQPGKRNDLDSVAGAVLAGQKLDTIVSEYPVQYIKFKRGIEALYFERKREATREFRRLEVLVYYGDAGTGKTRTAVEKDPNDYYILDQGERLWFDGYRGEKVLIIDDFYGWIKYGTLLRILDGYQYRCEIKGGFVYAEWTTVIITSNKPPSEWYTQGMTAALRRRITSSVHFTNLE